MTRREGKLIHREHIPAPSEPDACLLSHSLNFIIISYVSIPVFDRSMGLARHYQIHQ